MLILPEQRYKLIRKFNVQNDCYEDSYLDTYTGNRSTEMPEGIDTIRIESHLPDDLVMETYIMRKEG
jgi:hypothetical protein